MTTAAAVAAILVLLVMWAAAWCLPPHRNCRECGTDHTARAARFSEAAEAFAAWQKEEEEAMSRHWVQAHQVTGQPARAWCSTCPWEWEARPGEDLADADTAMQAHRRNTEAGRTE